MGQSQCIREIGGGSGDEGKRILLICTLNFVWNLRVLRLTASLELEIEKQRRAKTS